MSHPRYIFADSEEPELLHSIAEKEGRTPVFPVQVVESPNQRALIVHYRTASHSDETPDLSAILIVLQRADGAMIYREVLNAHVSAPTMQSMFVLDDLLIYSRQRSILSALPL